MAKAAEAVLPEVAVQGSVDSLVAANEAAKAVSDEVTDTSAAVSVVDSNGTIIVRW